MPEAARRLCAHPGCGTLVARGYCQPHQTVRYRNEERRRGTAKQRGYDADWRRMREQAMTRDSGLCVLCLSAGITTLATEVDHIVPLEQDRSLRLVLSNLQSLCHDCHERKSAAEQSRRMGA